MEAFESFVALALEADGFVVSSGVKFPIKRQTQKASHVETQTHGYEVDLVAARANRLVLASVKSFFGSGGVMATHVLGTAIPSQSKRYLLFNDDDIRAQVVRQAARQYGYTVRQVELRLYVGRFAAPTKGHHEDAIRSWAATQRVGSGSIKVIGVDEVVDSVLAAAAHKQYRNHEVLVTMKVLQAAGHLDLPLPEVGLGKET